MVNRIKGTKLSLEIGTTEIHTEATSVELNNEEASGDVTTFGDAVAGGARQFFITISGVQSTDIDSFWRYLWANTGATAAYTFRPHGNAVATDAQPHFTGFLTVGPPPKLGGAAGTTSTFTFDTRLDCTGKPVMVGPPAGP